MRWTEKQKCLPAWRGMAVRSVAHFVKAVNKTPVWMCRPSSEHVCGNQPCRPLDLMVVNIPPTFECCLYCHTSWTNRDLCVGRTLFTEGTRTVTLTLYVCLYSPHSQYHYLYTNAHKRENFKLFRIPDHFTLLILNQVKAWTFPSVSPVFLSSGHTVKLQRQAA